jgi:glycosyltransferase involved in cell wall biosynthesis
MKVMVLHDKARNDMGGMRNFIAAQNALMRESGWQVQEIIATPQAQAYAQHIRPSGRRLGILPLMELRKSLAEHQPQALIAHSPYYALGPIALMGLAACAPLIYYLHDVTPLCPKGTRLHRDGGICTQRQGMGCLRSACYRPLEGRALSNTYGLATRWLQSKAAQHVRHWVTPSHYLADLLVQHGIFRDRITVVPHFLSTHQVADAHPPTQPIAGRLLFVGRLVEEKGVECLLRAVKQLTHPEWTLHIAGVGPQEASLRLMTHALGLEGRVQFLGSLDADAVARAYQQAAMVVMPSLIPESFGLVGIEALLHARPVVGFASGGMVEWLRHQHTGLVAEWGNAQSLCESIDTLLQKPELGQHLGMNGHAMVLQEYSQAAHIQRLTHMVQKVGLA